MGSSKRKCFDCKHYIDAVAADTLDDWVIGSKFGFYHHFVAVFAGHRSIAYRSTGSIGSIRDVDRLARYVICRSHLAVAAAVVVAVVVGLAAGFEIYLALYGPLIEQEDQRFSVGDLKRNYRVVRISREVVVEHEIYLDSRSGNSTPMPLA
jgi:hypothetical protein